ncbi:hypothetical protein D9615_009802 [Tricholomella constricta]|uniref:N-acetyltransferase domain-containing protein n=1 Tax=Tricholomella constricta TaxID=117010 RepID=A0A8H5GTI0_9AGAR|nr:hypothetical protein D9615_009802 [Tricholomella constricta]
MGASPDIKRKPVVHVYNHTEHAHWLPAFADLHIACIHSDATIVAFVSPLDPNKVIQYWEERAAEVEAGSRVTVFALSGDGKELAGFVSLNQTMTQTQPFVGSIEKLLVSPNHRRRGVARAVMEAIERIAEERGRTVLTLHTEEGSPAELMYPRLGYLEFGRIPTFMVSPHTRELKGDVGFYKILSSHGTRWDARTKP